MFLFRKLHIPRESRSSGGHTYWLVRSSGIELIRKPKGLRSAELASLETYGVRLPTETRGAVHALVSTDLRWRGVT